ncbi:TPA: hypothetical protein QDZ12_004185 [Pseudomonas putida]|uniref:hypothetical protein n=1 Tax=Pseudomonas sp. HD6515 TaxID=2856556 RepID=UPI00217F1F10|nr:hypothetical protein [Pseudomonas sp. HD6515]ELS0925999.1 hypothetical protein [Pseudomonas putida]UWH23486.1 hypothetical protein KW568_03440 [Pseudomonas sp. HD6515]HDS0940887.1 hypothetical protein [Pseudomonas putida]
MTWLNGAVDDSDILNRQQALEFTSETPQPGFLQGSLDIIGPSLKRGGIEAVNSIEAGVVNLAGTEVMSTIATGMGAGYAPGFDAEKHAAEAARGAEELSAEIGRDTAASVKDLRPDPVEVGMAGQVIGELAAVLPRAIAGSVIAGPAGLFTAAGAPAGYSRTQVSTSEGIDPETAMKLGATEGLTIGVGAVLPAARFVGPALGDAAIAVGANVGLGIAHRGASAEILRANGYEAQAAQYEMLNKTALVTDAVLGVAFFGVGRGYVGKSYGAVKEFAGRAAEKVGLKRPTPDQVDAALTDRNAQHADIDTAPGLAVDARSAVAHQDALAAAIASINRGEPVILPDSIHSAEFLRRSEAPAPKVPTRDEALATAREELEPAIRTDLEGEVAGLLPNVADVRTELASVQRTLGDLDGTFRERARQAQGEGMSRKKAEAAARQEIAQERQQLTDRITALEDALQGNRSGELARGELAAIARGETPERLQPRIEARADEIMRGFDRSPLAAGVARAGERLTPRQLNERAAREEIDTLMREHEATLPREPSATPASRPGETAAARPATNAAESGTPRAESETAQAAAPAAREGGEARSDAEPPELQVLRDTVACNPEAVVNTGYDADGKPTTARADEVLAEIEAEHQAGTREAQSYLAAITCMLRF